MELISQLPEHIQMRLQSIESRMAHIGALSRRIELRFEAELGKTSPERLVAAMEKAAHGIEPFIRNIIMRHYNSSTLGTNVTRSSYQHTGWLKEAINGITVKLALRSIHGAFKFIPTLRIQFPTQMKHKAAAALNYGAVYAPGSTRAIFDLPTKTIMGVKIRPVVGRAGKRSLKKFAYTGKISKRARARIEAGSVFLGTRATPGVKIQSSPTGSGKSIAVGNGLLVRIPFPYFYFTPQDVGAIAFGFEDLLKKELGYAS